MSNENKSKFKIGSKVFANVKGHPPWPAIVNSINSKTRITKYNITFYGTGETALVKEIDVELFIVNKHKYEVKKMINNKFADAVKELEEFK